MQDDDGQQGAEEEEGNGDGLWNNFQSQDDAEREKVGSQFGWLFAGCAVAVISELICNWLLCVCSGCLRCIGSVEKADV